MKIRANMAYRAPAAQEYFGMRASELKAAAASGDAGAQAELDRRDANRKDPTTKAGQRAQKWEAAKQEKAGKDMGKARGLGADRANAKRDAAVQKAAEDGHLTDEDYAVEMGKYDTRAKMAALKAKRADDASLADARRDLETLRRAGRSNPDRALSALGRAGKKDRRQSELLLEQLRAGGQLGRDSMSRISRAPMNDVSDDTLRTLQRAGQKARKNPSMASVRRNGMPYPGATVMYPHQGIVNGGTGPFVGPTGTLFDRMPDLLWGFKSNGKRKNPRMEGVDILWPKDIAQAGVIQGGSKLYMSYPSAAPFDRMPNLTRALKNKKRSH